MDNDYELLYLAKEDHENIVNILYKKYKKVLYSKALKYSSSKTTIEDYLNEAKLTLHEAVKNYQDDSPFITYLNTCLNNNLSNYKKSLKRNKHKILNEAVSIDNEELEKQFQLNDERYNPEKLLLEEQEYLELKEKILSTLTWKEELVFNLKEQNYTSKEISEITDNNLRTVYNIINRIQNKVSKIM